MTEFNVNVAMVPMMVAMPQGETIIEAGLSKDNATGACAITWLICMAGQEDMRVTMLRDAITNLESILKAHEERLARNNAS